MTRILHIPTGVVLHKFSSLDKLQEFLNSPCEYYTTRCTIPDIKDELYNRFEKFEYAYIYELEINELIPRTITYQQDAINIKKLNILEFEVLDG